MDYMPLASKGIEMSAKRAQTCCFTGHRQIPASQYQAISDKLERVVENLIKSGVRYFGAGGALGFDTLAAQTVLRLRHQYQHIKLILVLPCLSQSKNWNVREQETYEAIKAQANKVVYTSHEYTPDCMFKRNRHLVDWSGICVCYLVKERGGTAYTVDYAWQRGLKVLNLVDNI